MTGVYYPAGGAICRLVNRDRAEHGIRCGVESTGGSIFNINAIRSGELEFGVAQSDWQFHAANGSSSFEENGAFEDLRAVFSLHPEPFTVVARADAGITNFDDLAGKRVNIGNPGSGQRRHYGRGDGSDGLDRGHLRASHRIAARRASRWRCATNNVDAIVYTDRPPRRAPFQEATTACDTVLVNVDNDAIRGLVEENSYYRMATIPGGMYPRATREDVDHLRCGRDLCVLDRRVG